jgi:6-phosphogluconate dehydrogenase
MAAAAQASAPIGVTGLGVMGRNLARNFARHGYAVALHNRTASRTTDIITQFGHEGTFAPAQTAEEFVASLERPRRVLIMVNAGAATDAVIDEFAPLLEPGDMLIDGGNAHFHDTRRREAKLRERRLHFVGMGVSGGEEGALHGPSIMPGGSNESYQALGPMLETISAHVDGVPCCTHIGPDGAGHFVKMVHNGIEYADMQLIAEAYDLLRHGLGFEPARIAEIFRTWNAGRLNSYLIEITAEVLAHTDAATGQPFVDIVLDQAEQKGTGRWTVQDALDLGVPVSGIAEAVFARSLSGHADLRRAARDLPGPRRPSDQATVPRRPSDQATVPRRPSDQATVPRRPLDQAAVPQPAEFADQVEQALYASKLVSYAQGWNMIDVGSREYDWNIDLGQMATIWRGGCIIRAKFLDRIRAAYQANPELPTLLADEEFGKDLAAAQYAWRNVLATAVRLGIPAPGFSAALSYYDALRAERLPAALIQGLRDFFGAHTYRRTDRPGTFHTLWAQDRSEVTR